MSHIPPYLYLSREDGHDVIDIGKHDFRSVLLHSMLPNANLCQHWPGGLANQQMERIIDVELRTACSQTDTDLEGKSVWS